MEQWNRKEFEAMVREANKTRNISLYEVQQRTYIKLYKDLHISTGIDPSGEFCSYAPLLSSEDNNLSLAEQRKKIDCFEEIPSFETFQRTFKRELSKILDVMLNQENSLGLFKQGNSYQFSTVQSEVIQNLLYLWTSKYEDAENFSKERYNEISPQFLQDLQKHVCYLLMGCFEDSFDLEELQQTWRKRFKSEIKTEWEKAKERLWESLRILKEVLCYCILDEIAPNDIMDNEIVDAGVDQKSIWSIKDQIKYMVECEGKLTALANEFFDNSVRGQNKAHDEFMEKLESEELFRRILEKDKKKREGQKRSSEDKSNKFFYY